MLERGMKIGRYEIVAPIGRGGMGHVFRARDPELHRDVALKVLREDDVDPTELADARERFLREGRAAAALRHPNIITVFDVGVHESSPYLVMELLDGASLRTLIMSGASTKERLGWLSDIAKALAHAHAASLVHRDVKPDNVIVGSDGVLKVLDFGLAKPLSPRPGFTFDTQDERALGTPRYMAPEQIVGARADAKSDQFAWGRTLFEVLTRSLPPRPKELPRLETVMPEAPKMLADLLARTQAPLPTGRFPSMDDVRAELEAVMKGLGDAPAIDAGTTRPEVDAKALAPTRREALEPPAPKPLERRTRRSLPRSAIFLAAAAPGAIIGVIVLAMLAQRTEPTPASMASASSVVSLVLPSESLTVPPHASAPPKPMAAPRTSCLCRERRLGRFFGALCTTAQKGPCRCLGRPTGASAVEELCPAAPNEEGNCATDMQSLEGSVGKPCEGFTRARGREAERVPGTYSCSLCVTPPRHGGMTPGASCKGYGTWSTEMLEGAWDCAAP